MLAILDLNVKQGKFVTFGISVYYVLLYWWLLECSALQPHIHNISCVLSTP